jgi:hypothetical protein
MVSKCSVTLCSLDSRVKVITSTQKKMLRYDTMEVENSHETPKTEIMLLYSFINSVWSLYIVFQYPGKKGRNTKDNPELPALVRCILWFGLDSDSKDWTGHHDEGSFTVFAETVG